MTYREQRRGQYWSLHFLAIFMASIVAASIPSKWWLIVYLAIGWEMILWSTGKHRCWCDDIDLDEMVPLDQDGKPLV